MNCVPDLLQYGVGVRIRSDIPPPMSLLYSCVISFIVALDPLQFTIPPAMHNVSQQFVYLPTSQPPTVTIKITIIIIKERDVGMQRCQRCDTDNKVATEAS